MIKYKSYIESLHNIAVFLTMSLLILKEMVSMFNWFRYW